MIKLKRLKSILIITSLTLGISILFIHSYISTTSTYNTGSSNSLNEGQVLADSSSTYTEKLSDTLFFKEQNNNITIATSRGSRSRSANINKNQIINKPESISEVTQNTAIKVSSTSSTNVKSSTKTKTSSEAPIEISQTASKEAAPITPAESKSITKTIEVSQNTQTELLPITPSEVSTYSADDLDLLARLITAEAQAEPYGAQVAVGAVVMNRVRSSSFPDSIREVIYQNINGYYQFSPVVNGWINKPALPDSIKAAKDALNGIDPTNGAMFFYDNTTTNTWLLSKPISISIGTMIYAY